MDLFTMETKKVSDIKNNEKISLYVKIENISVQQTVNKTDFFNLLLVDETGSIYAKKWNITEDEKKLFKRGQIVYVSGYGNEYNDKVQLIINEIREVNEQDDIDLKLFYQQAPISIEELKNQIIIYIETIENKNLSIITKTLFKKYEESYLVFPAASKNHHAFISGLAYHVLTMLKLAKDMKKTYPNINLDLLYSGIILHDIGKVIELSDYLAPEYTLEGKLIGHINISFAEISRIENQLDLKGEEILLLKHMILSHHGLLEYGSPKRPVILEAEVLHFLDLIDSRINMIETELEETAENEFTKRMYPLDGRAFYKHKI